MRAASLDARDRQDHIAARVEAAGDQRVRARDDLSRAKHGVRGEMRLRSVATGTAHHDFESIGCSHDGTGPGRDRACRQAGPVVQGVDLVTGVLLE